MNRAWEIGEGDLLSFRGKETRKARQKSYIWEWQGKLRGKEREKPSIKHQGFRKGPCVRRNTMTAKENKNNGKLQTQCYENHPPDSRWKNPTFSFWWKPWPVLSSCPERWDKGRSPYPKARPELHASAITDLPLHQGKDLTVQGKLSQLVPSSAFSGLRRLFIYTMGSLHHGEPFGNSWNNSSCDQSQEL